MATRHGPSLPYSVVAGVTACASGWLVASAKLLGATMAVEDPRVAATFSELLDERPPYAVIGLNAPVGFSVDAATGSRACECEARLLLGRQALTISGPAILAGGPGSGEVEGGPELDRLDGLDELLAARYDEVATDMLPYRQRSVYEVHPETSFYQLNDDVPLGSSPVLDDGRAERRALIEGRVPGSERILDAVLDGISPGQLLAVAACLWTARRIAAHTVVRIPTNPEWDELGLRAEIVR